VEAPEGERCVSTGSRDDPGRRRRSGRVAGDDASEEVRRNGPGRRGHGGRQAPSVPRRGRGRLSSRTTSRAGRPGVFLCSTPPEPRTCSGGVCSKCEGRQGRPALWYSRPRGHGRCPGIVTQEVLQPTRDGRRFPMLYSSWAKRSAREGLVAQIGAARTSAYLPIPYALASPAPWTSAGGIDPPFLGFLPPGTSFPPNATNARRTNPMAPKRAPGNSPGGR